MREKRYYKDMKRTQEEEKGNGRKKKQNNEKLALVRKVAKRLRRKIKRERLAKVRDRRLGDVDYLETVEALTCGELGTDDAEPTEILLSVTYGAGLPAGQAEAIEDALLSCVKALPFPADDIFRGSGDGTREYAAMFVL